MYAVCYFCHQWEWVHSGGSSMFCSPACERASREIAQLEARVADLLRQLAARPA